MYYAASNHVSNETHKKYLQIKNICRKIHPKRIKKYPVSVEASLHCLRTEKLDFFSVNWYFFNRWQI